MHSKILIIMDFRLKYFSLKIIIIRYYSNLKNNNSQKLLKFLVINGDLLRAWASVPGMRTTSILQSLRTPERHIKH